MNTDTLIILFTAKTSGQMLKDGGSWSWVLNPQSMRDVKYAVCVRNSDPRFDEECGHRPEPHNSAFFVGRIKGIRKVGRENDRDRYIIEFSEYAIINDPVPNFRHGSTRNPVTYGDVDQAQDKGLDIEKLDWRPMPEPSPDARFAIATPEDEQNDEDVEGLTISQAKAGLAITFGVPVSAITITVSA